jgi:hypothetical protein
VNCTLKCAARSNPSAYTNTPSLYCYTFPIVCISFTVTFHVGRTFPAPLRARSSVVFHPAGRREQSDLAGVPYLPGVGDNRTVMVAGLARPRCRVVVTFRFVFHAFGAFAVVSVAPLALVYFSHLSLSDRTPNNRVQPIRYRSRLTLSVGCIS